jgi:hypothetical protein
VNLCGQEAAVPHLSPTTLTTDEQRLMPLITTGRDAVTERTLRPIVAEPVWERQLAAWRSLTGRPDDERARCLRRKRTGEEDFATAMLSELDDVQ